MRRIEVSAVVLAMAALLLQMARVPQRLIPFFSGTAAEPERILPQPHEAGSQTVPVDESDATQLQDLPASTPDPVDHLGLDAGGAPRADFILPLQSQTDLELASLRPFSAEAQRAESERRAWLMLSVAQHGAAAFDAWSTRRAISTGRARELNPLLRPFAGNASVYLAVQAGPFLLDYLSRRMMSSRHGWIRHTWWVPQAVGTAVSLFSGFHNLNVASASAP